MHVLFVEILFNSLFSSFLLYSFFSVLSFFLLFLNETNFPDFVRGRIWSRNLSFFLFLFLESTCIFKLFWLAVFMPRHSYHNWYRAYAGHQVFQMSPCDSHVPQSLPTVILEEGIKCLDVKWWHYNYFYFQRNFFFRGSHLGCPTDWPGKLWECTSARPSSHRCWSKW